MERKVIAPYVKESRLPDLETSIQIADQALLYYKCIHRRYPGQAPNPGACVALALYQTGLDTEERVSRIAKMTGKTMEGFLKIISEARSLLNLPFNISFDQLATNAHLPIRLAATAKKIFTDLQAEFPDDKQVNRAAIYGAVMLVVAIKRGFKKDLTLQELARVTSADPDDIMSCESMIRELMGKKYGLRSKKRQEEEEEVTRGASKELKRAADKAMEELKAEQAAPKKKKVQTTLSFALVPRKEEA